MPFRRPRFPQLISRGHVLSKFRRIQKRELGDTVSKVCIELESLYRTVPWVKVEKLRELSRMKHIKRFSQDKANELVNDAREVIDEHCEGLSKRCIETSEKLLEIEKETEDDGKGANELLIEMAELAKDFAEETSKESIEQKLLEYKDEYFSHMDGISNQRFDGVKKGFVRIVEGIKKVIEVDFDPSLESAKINEALTYGFRSVHPVINGYVSYLENGIGDTTPEEVREDLEPITKFASDDSMFIYEVEHDELERKIKTICTEEAKKEDIQKHCITLLEAVKALPVKYKE